MLSNITKYFRGINNFKTKLYLSKFLYDQPTELNLSKFVFYQGPTEKFGFELNKNNTIQFELCDNKEKQYDHILNNDIMCNPELLKLGIIRNMIWKIIYLMDKERFFLDTNYEKIIFLYYGKNIVYELNNPKGNKGEIYVLQLCNFEFYQDKLF